MSIIKYKTIESPIKLKKWRSDAKLDIENSEGSIESVSSSNINRLMYNDETRELVIRFNGGVIYTYFDIDFTEFLGVLNGAGVCRTSGKNKWGEWFVGKTPSVGAAVFRILIRSGKDYKRGGSLR